MTLDEIDLEIHLVKENVVLSRDSRSSEKFMHGIKVLMAKNYIDNLSEETRKGMLEKAEQGIWPTWRRWATATSRARTARRSSSRTPRSPRSSRRLFEWYATGKHSLEEVAEMAQAAGLIFRKSGDRCPGARSTRSCATGSTPAISTGRARPTAGIHRRSSPANSGSGCRPSWTAGTRSHARSSTTSPSRA